MVLFRDSHTSKKIAQPRKPLLLMPSKHGLPGQHSSAARRCYETLLIARAARVLGLKRQDVADFFTKDPLCLVHLDEILDVPAQVKFMRDTYKDIRKSMRRQRIKEEQAKLQRLQAMSTCSGQARLHGQGVPP